MIVVVAKGVEERARFPDNEGCPNGRAEQPCFIPHAPILQTHADLVSQNGQAVALVVLKQRGSQQMAVREGTSKMSAHFSHSRDWPSIAVLELVKTSIHACVSANRPDSLTSVSKYTREVQALSGEDRTG